MAEMTAAITLRPHAAELPNAEVRGALPSAEGPHPSRGTCPALTRWTCPAACPAGPTAPRCPEPGCQPPAEPAGEDREGSAACRPLPPHPEAPSAESKAAGCRAAGIYPQGCGYAVRIRISFPGCERL